MQELSISIKIMEKMLTLERNLWSAQIYVIYKDLMVTIDSLENLNDRFRSLIIF